jgi:hypothetical protein
MEVSEKYDDLKLGIVEIYEKYHNIEEILSL